MSTPTDFTDDERASIAHHLRVAAERYDENAKLMTQEGQSRVAAQFVHQAQQARTPATRIDPDGEQPAP